MKYIFREGNHVGECPVEWIVHCWYGGTQFCNERSFEERHINPEKFNYHDLVYLETEEERKEQGVDHSRMIVVMKNGEIYELMLRKVTDDKDLSVFTSD